MYSIDSRSYRTNPNGFNSRIRHLILHYTALDFEASIKTLANGSSVSAHYLVPDPTDGTYISAGFKDMRIFNLVDENNRAWHAGVSFWASRVNLNDSSIGIEIVNLASETGGKFTFPPFNPTQIDAVISLCSNILQRSPDIAPN